jgi:hypothetical protein
VCCHARGQRWSLTPRLMVPLLMSSPNGLARLRAGRWSVIRDNRALNTRSLRIRISTMTSGSTCARHSRRRAPLDSPPGHHALERRAVLGPAKALRFAPPTRSAWPSGRDGACAQLGDGTRVMASLGAAALVVLLEVDGALRPAYSAFISPVSYDTSSASHPVHAGRVSGRGRHGTILLFPQTRVR